MLFRSGPELFYVEDDGGRLVPVPGFRYRDFIELLRLKDGLPSQPEPPAAVLETFTLLATVPQPPAGEAAAALSCPAEVRLTVRQLRPGWVSVPIDLRGFLVGGVPAHEGPGEMFLAADGGGEGGMARLWLNSTEGGNDVRHTVTLRGVVPVESSSIADTATFFVPSATASRVEVRTRRQDPSVTVRPASSPALIEPAPVAGEGSVVTIVGASGPIEVRIADRRSQAIPITAPPEVMAESLVRVDGQTAIVDAVLRLDNLPADM